MTELCKALGIDKLRSTSYRPETNGQLERFHRTLNSLIGKVVSDHQHDWEDFVSPALAAYRATIHEATGFTPNFLVFGREVNLPLDLAYGVDPAESQAADSFEHFVSRQQDRLREAYALARDALGRAVSRNKRNYDLRARPEEFTVGTWVWLYSPRRYTGRCPKWQKLYSGPYLVVQRLGPVNLILQRSARAKRFITHVDKLKRCLSPTPTSWLGDGGVVAGEGAVTSEGGAIGPDGAMDGDGPRAAEGATRPRVGKRRGPRGGNRPVEDPVEQGPREEGEEGRPRRIVRRPRRFLE